MSENESGGEGRTGSTPPPGRGPESGQGQAGTGRDQGPIPVPDMEEAGAVLAGVGGLMKVLWERLRQKRLEEGKPEGRDVWDKAYKKDPYRNLPYVTVRAMFVSGLNEQGKELSPREFENLERSRRMRYLEASSYHVFDQLEGDLRNTLIQSDWDNYETHINELAQKMENDAQGVGGYRDNDRIRGAVDDVVSGTILLVRREGLKQIADESRPSSERVRKKLKITDLTQTMNNLNDQIEQEVLWYPSYRDRLANFVDMETSDQRQQRLENEKATQAAADEDARRKQELQLARARIGAQQPPPTPQGIDLTGDMGDRFGRGFETRLELPPNPDNQRAIVRQILDSIEKSNRDIVMDWSLSSTVKALEGALDNMDVGVANEVRARLAVYDSAYLIKQTDGWIARSEKIPGHIIGTAASEAKRRGHDLTKHTVETLLKEGLEGYNIARAWDLLQDINVVGKDNKYKDYISKAQQAGLITPDVAKDVSDYTKFKNYSYYTDNNVVRREAVRSVLVEELGGGEIGEKSLQLAERLAVASLETSVWNKPAGVGNDQLAEIIWLKDWRTEKRFKIGRAGGPEAHLDFIEGFGNSWLRAVVPKGTKEFVRDQPIYAGGIFFDEIKVDDWSTHCIIAVGRYNELRELLLNETPKPFEVTVTVLKSMVQHFNNADEPLDKKDKDGEPTLDTDGEPIKTKVGGKRLRVYWLLGLIDSALGHEELGWDQRALDELKKATTRDELSEKAGTFITPNQWKWIENGIHAKRRAIGLGVERAVQAGFGVGRK